MTTIRRSSAWTVLAAIFATCALAVPAHAAGEPTVTRAVTGDNGDGRLDKVTIAFSAAMQTTQPQASWFASDSSQDGFYVEGYKILSGAWTSTSVPELVLTLEPLPAYDTGATPVVRYRPVTNGPRSAVTQLPLDSTNVTATDGAGPVIAAASARDVGSVNLFGTAGDTLEIRFSEPVLLAGAGPTRAANLENAIKFVGVAADGVNGCPLDGTALSNQNFPQQSTGQNPVTPDSAATASQTITVAMKANNQASTQRFVGVPRGCALAVESANNSNALITDAKGNAARPFNVIAGRSITTRIEPAPIDVTRIATVDGVASTPDGVPDGIEFTFAGPVLDETVAALAQLTTVRAGSDPLTMGAFETGANANDHVVRFATSMSAALAANTISLTYAGAPCNHTAAGTETTGPKGAVPYGAPFFACVAAFDTTAVDGVGPAVLSAVTVDADADGKTDGADVTFSEPLAASAPAGWTLGGRNAETLTADSSNPARARITVAETAAPDGGELPALAYVSNGTPTADSSGNEVPSATWPTSDGVGPAILSATALDLDDDGDIDRVSASLSEAATIASTPEIRYGSTDAVSATIDGTTLSVELPAGIGSGAAPLTVSAGITDAGGAPMPASSFQGVTETVAPRGTVTVSPSAPLRSGEATIRVTYTEAMQEAPLDVTFAGAPVSPKTDADHSSNGWLLADPSVWEGSVTIDDTTCTASAGCPVEIRAEGGNDLAGLAQHAPAVLATFVDTVAPAAATITAAGGTNGAPDNVVNGHTSRLQTVVDVPDGEVDGGSVEIYVDGAPMTPPVTATVPAGASSVTVTSAHTSNADLVAALGGEGTHLLRTELCDAAGNCTAGPESEILVDTTVAEVELVSAAQERVVRAGTAVPIAWTATASEEGTSVRLEAASGSSWSTIADSLPMEGTYSWQVPNVNRIYRVRAVSLDEAGNTFATDDVATVIADRSAPKVRKFSVPRKVRSGRKVAVRWSARDLTFEFARRPIRIQQSFDGRRWRNINGGRASTENDGREVWKVPNGTRRVFLRLVARDGVGRVTIVRSRSIRRVR